MVYFLLNLSCSIIIGIQNKTFIEAIVLPLIFITIHLSYGFGFFIGSLNNMFKKRN